MNHTYRLLEMGQELGIDTQDLLTRDLGRKAFIYFEQELERMADGGTLILDANGIVLMDSSFFDEAILNLFVKLVEEKKYGNRYLLLTDISKDSLVNIEGAVARRKLKFAMPIRDGDLWLFAGALEPNLEDAAKLLVAKKELTAREVADRLKIGISSASNRMRRLFELRLAKRVEESSETGLSHRYFLIA